MEVDISKSQLHEDREYEDNFLYEILVSFKNIFEEIICYVKIRWLKLLQPSQNMVEDGFSLYLLSIVHTLIIRATVNVITNHRSMFPLKTFHT